MKEKTKVIAENGKQEILIIREFDLNLDLLFTAYIKAELIEQWMGTKVIKLNNNNHGSYEFETIDPTGNKHRFHGTIHSIESNKSIIRTFEMENSNLPVQLEFLNFESLGQGKSKLEIQIVFKSIADRDNLLKLPFAWGINMAHNRLQSIFQ